MSAKVAAQEILADLRRVQQELGRVPTRVEFKLRSRFSSLQVTEIFGSYQLLLKMSGLAYSAKGRRDKEQIKKESFEHLLREVSEKKSAVNPPAIFHRALIIGDTHFPYVHPDAVEWLIALDKQYRFDLILHAGDEIDLHAMSFHDHDPDLLSPGHELDAAIRMMEPLYRAFPNMLLAESNHGSLVHRKAKHHGFPRRVIKSYRETIEAPVGWEWREFIRWQSANGQANMLVHALGSNVLQVAKFKGLNVIQGHHHSLHGVQYWHNDEKNAGLFAVQAGCLINDTSYALAYNKLTKERPVIGSAAVINGVPKLLPMFLNASGRWNGKLP